MRPAEASAARFEKAMPDVEEWLVGVTWPSHRRFAFAEELARRVAAPVRCVGAWFPRRQTRWTKRLLVWPMFLWVSLQLFAQSWRAGRRIVCWQQVHGIGLGLAWRLLERLGLRSRAAVDVLTFIITARKRRGLWRWLIAQALQAEAIKTVIVFNEAELAVYRALFPLSAHKMQFVLYTAAEVPAPPVAISDDGFYLAVGRSNRDHEFLIRSFAAYPQRRLVVLSDQHEVAESPNVAVCSNVFGEDYYAQLARCRAVVLAFHEPELAAGQLVYLQAIQYGKPVLASVSHCLDGYVVDDRTGLYFNKNTADLSAALTRVEAANWYASAVAACLADYPQRFGFARLAAGYLGAIQPIAHQPL
jgi:glycosyltransferase involved in cell wall biosynthesis